MMAWGKKSPKSKIKIGDNVDYGYGKGKVTHIRNNFETQLPESFKVDGKYRNNVKKIKGIKF